MPTFRRRTLDEPEIVHPHRRHLFHPKRGWFRRLERWLSSLLSARIYPHFPILGAVYSRQIERDLTVAEVEIGIRSLGSAFDGLQLLLVSDIHTGAFLPPPILSQTFERLASLAPDVILLCGDLITTRLEDLTENLEAFAALGAPLGVFAVLGNHDHYTEDVGALKQQLEETGVELLHNRSIELKCGGDRLFLAGIDDWLMGEPDLPAALEGVERPTVLLSHNPDSFFDAAASSVDLVLSGHTHAGQIRVPGLGVLVRQSRYGLDDGRYRLGECELVVSRGLGAVGLPLRLACPPEAVLIRLRQRTPPP